MDGQDVQDDFHSLIDSRVSCESFGFEFRIAKMYQQADLDSSCLYGVNNLGLVLGSDRLCSLDRDDHPVNPANPCSFLRLCQLVMAMPVYLCTGAYRK